MTKLQGEYIQLFKVLNSMQDGLITPLPDSGSSRKYFRFAGKNRHAIGVFNENIAENEAFFSFASSLASIGVPVPEILIVSADRKFYLQTDLGDQTLFNILLNYSGKDFDDAILKLLVKAIRQMLVLQFKAVDIVDFKLSWPTAEYSQKTILDDLYYFKYYFLKVMHGLHFNEYLLDKEFESFAKRLAQAPSAYFMYRDFQSRNIMLHDDNLWFIDFQGARKGPLQYDLVSFLFQARAGIPDTVRDYLIELYIDELKLYTDPDKIEFRKFLPYFIYFRLFQVLGAYGFRGLIQKRPHFIQSIPFALKILADQLIKNELRHEFPYLNEVLSDALMLHEKTTIQTNQSKVLHIQLSSFSYKKGGIPVDYSGNGGGHVFDCRTLPNPGREEQYKKLTGKDISVIDFLEKCPEVTQFFDGVKIILKLSIDNYIDRNFNSLMISFGCTGGQHRSVYFAEKTFSWIQMLYPGVSIALKHHEL